MLLDIISRCFAEVGAESQSGFIISRPARVSDGSWKGRNDAEIERFGKFPKDIRYEEGRPRCRIQYV